VTADTQGGRTMAEYAVIINIYGNVEKKIFGSMHNENNGSDIEVFIHLKEIIRSYTYFVDDISGESLNNLRARARLYFQTNNEGKKVATTTIHQITVLPSGNNIPPDDEDNSIPPS
jgi:hypothetical protein